MAIDNKEDKPVIVNKWDQNAVKNALDDCVKMIFNDEFGYVESHRLLDIRLALSIISVAFAGTALLWDYLYPFPTSRPVLLVCAISYFILSGVLQLYTWYIEKGTFYVGIERDPTGKRPDRQWMFSSKMQKWFDHMYTLEVQYYGENGERRHNQLDKSVTAWVDDDGKVLMDNLRNDAVRLHESIGDSKKKN